jgi:O-methyltransferase domain
MATLTDDAPVSVQLERLAAEIAEAGKALSTASADQDWDLRYKAHRAAQLVVALTQKPEDVWFDQSVIMTEFPAIRLFMKWKAFENIPSEGSISYKELAEKCEVQEALLSKNFVVLTCATIDSGYDSSRRLDDGCYWYSQANWRGSCCSYTKLQDILQLPPFWHHVPDYVRPELWIIVNYLLTPSLRFDEALVPYSRHPDYFEKYGRKEPTTQNHNPFSFGFGKPDAMVWEIMNENPERMRAFMQSMNTLEQHLPITGMYDFGWVDKIAKEQPERILFVDVGGGKGQAIRAISKEHPELPRERFVLQDRPDVIDEVKKLDMEELRGAQLMPHNFHTTQPIKSKYTNCRFYLRANMLQGALIYWIRRCIHDYGDDDCANMLKQLADVMSPDSKCLVVEQVMTNPPTPLVAYTDFCMLNIGGKERTLKNFQDLAVRAGLKVVKHWPSKTSAVGVVECEKV